MQKTRLMVGIGAALGVAAVSDVWALSDITNLGDSWKGWNMTSPRAVEQGMESGEAWLYPSVSANVVMDDNYYNTNTNKESATTVTITPRLVAELEGDTTVIKGSAEIDYQYNFHDSDDNSWGARLVGEVGWAPTERLNLWGGLGWEYGVEARGTGLASSISPDNPFFLDDPLEYDVFSVRVGGTYGVDEHGAPKLNFEASHEEKEYRNFREITEARDSETDTLGAGLHYWLQPNTAATFDARYSDNRYGDSFYDSEQWRYLLGLQWDMTYQTQGYAKAGWGYKDMDDPSLEDSDAMNWEVGVNWRPSDRANFALSASRDFMEADYAGYTDTREYRASWRHQWETYFSSSLIYNIGTSDYPLDLYSLSREDDFWDVELSLNYEFRPWLTFGASARHSDRDSTLDEFSYDENVYTLRMDMTFH